MTVQAEERSALALVPATPPLATLMAGGELPRAGGEPGARPSVAVESVSVVIPARNEAAALGALLT